MFMMEREGLSLDKGRFRDVLGEERKRKWQKSYLGRRKWNAEMLGFCIRIMGF